MKFVNLFLISIIKFYRHFVSPYVGSHCRYLPTCSEYFADCIKLNGTIKGCALGIKRILRCHPIKLLGASDGFDPAPNLKIKKKEK